MEEKTGFISTQEKINRIMNGFAENLADIADSDLESDNVPAELIMGGVQIDTLSQLREHFVLEEAIDFVRDRTLIRWLKQLYYEKEAKAIRALRVRTGDTFSAKDKRELCEILGVEYQSVLSGEEKEEADKHTEALKHFTDDETVLKNSTLVALNQKQLAKLLDDGETKIYLCHNEFSIPLKKTGIHYIGVDNPVISNPFTAQQYKKLDITMENISLPSEIDPETESTLNYAASESGYDFYYEQHSDFENEIHTALKCEVMFRPYHLTDNSDYNYFKSKYECEKAKENCIRTAYDEAHKILGTTDSDCVMKRALDYYCGWIERCFADIMPYLEDCCRKNGLISDYEKLDKLVGNARTELEKQYSDELENNREYYHLYSFDYFLSKVEIQRLDYGVDGEGLAFLWGVITGEGIEYTFDGSLDAIIEMNNDLDRLVTSFANRAHEMYWKYVEEIEECIQPISKVLPEMKQNETLQDFLKRITTN